MMLCIIHIVSPCIISLYSCDIASVSLRGLQPGLKAYLY